MGILTGKGIQTGERLVHEQEFRFHNQGTDMASRCFMPLKAPRGTGIFTKLF
jgi:hypothetical protein